MNKICGLYLTVSDSGEIKRTLTTQSGEVKLKRSSVSDEILLFSELNFKNYIDVLKSISELSEETEDNDNSKNFGTVKMDVFEEMLKLTEDLADVLEEENPLHGLLTKTMLQDYVPKDDGTAMYVYSAKAIICDCLESVVKFQFIVNDILTELSQGNKIDLENDYRYLTQMEVVRIFSINKKADPQYRFRSLADYYKFLLINFIAMKPKVARCKCCGKYFVPKTKRATLYCDRLVKNGKTCKEIAPALKHRVSGKNSEVIREYDREKQKRYKRAERARDSMNSDKNMYEPFKEYYVWNDAATVARDSCIQGKLSEKEALAIITG